MAYSPNTTNTLVKFPTVKLIPQTPQLRILHTYIRDVTTTRENFNFHADRVIRLIVEEGLNEVPSEYKEVQTPTGATYRGLAPMRGICGVSIMRAGESMELGLRSVCRGARIGKILIQRDEKSEDKRPDSRFDYAKLPEDIAKRWVFLMDPMLATAGSAIKATEILIDKFQVAEEQIIFLNVVSNPVGISNYCARFPKVKIVTSAIDEGLNEDSYIMPGLGDFGDRYFGTA